MGLVREKLLRIASTKLYTQLEPAELQSLHDELRSYTRSGDPGLSQSVYLTLMEMLFFVDVYLSKDVEAEVIYNSFRDKFGEDSPNLYVMKATLLEINESDQAAVDYIEKLIKDSLEYDTDTLSYLLLQKKLLSIKARAHDREWLLTQLCSLIEKFPIDPELYWRAGELYNEFGQFDRAAYCFEEVLLIMPFNYVAFGQLAETLYYKSIKTEKAAQLRSSLQQSLNNALRSVELSENYLKGWSLVAMISAKLDDKKELNTLARERIRLIAGSSSSREKATADLILKNL